MRALTSVTAMVIVTVMMARTTRPQVLKCAKGLRHSHKVVGSKD